MSPSFASPHAPLPPCLLPPFPVAIPSRLLQNIGPCSCHPSCPLPPFGVRILVAPTQPPSAAPTCPLPPLSPPQSNATLIHLLLHRWGCSSCQHPQQRPACGQQHLQQQPGPIRRRYIRRCGGSHHPQQQQQASAQPGHHRGRYLLRQLPAVGSGAAHQAELQHGRLERRGCLL